MRDCEPNKGIAEDRKGKLPDLDNTLPCKDYNKPAQVPGACLEVELRSFTGGIASSLPLIDAGPASSDITAADSAAAQVSIESMRICEMSSAQLNELQDDIKDNGLIEVSSHTRSPFKDPVYSEVTLESDSCRQTVDKKKRSCKKKKDEGNSDNDVTKEIPLYSVVNLELKSSRLVLDRDKKLQRVVKKSKDEDACLDDITKQAPIYSVVNLKSKRGKRAVEECETTDAVDKAVKDADGLIEDVTKNTPLYSVVNLEQKHSRKAEKREQKKEFEDTSLDDDTKNIPVYSVVDLECKSSKRELDEVDKCEGSDKDKKDDVLVDDVLKKNPLYTVVNSEASEDKEPHESKNRK